MTYQEKDIALLVLSTGENVMGIVKSTNSQLGIVYLDNPVYLVPTEATQENPSGGLQTMAYLMFSEETVADFESKDVRHYLTPKEDIAAWFGQQFKSEAEKAIIVPDKPAIVIAK